MSFVFTNFGAVGLNYANAFIGGMFGSSHTSAFPSSYTLTLGTTLLTPYSATTTVTNDDSNWVGIASNGGVTNANRIAFSALTSGDVSGWDSTGLSLLVTDPGTVLVAVAMFESTDPLLTPSVGLVITIPAQRIIWQVNTV